MGPVELYDAATRGLAVTAPRVCRPWAYRRYALWLTEPRVVIGGRVWRARRRDWRGYGFTRRQVLQMKRVLAEGFLEWIAGSSSDREQHRR